VIMSVVFDHVDIAVSDVAASRAFYGEALGLPTVEGEWIEWGDFGTQPVDEEHPLTRNLHVAFAVAGPGRSRRLVESHDRGRIPKRWRTWPENPNTARATTGFHPRPRWMALNIDSGRRAGQAYCPALLEWRQ
jgi:catechol 2,3-dioxygenase-like lactoylglutathione lyase family enzyme